MSKLLRPIVGAALFLLVPCMALAQAPSPATPSAPATDTKADPAEATTKGGALAACRPDAEKLCANAPKGGRRNCLKENAAKLSPECTAAITDLEAKAKAMREACATDVKTHCAAGVKGPSIVQCLRENRGKLSPACGTAFEARYAKQ